MVRDGYFYGGALLLVALLVRFVTGGWAWSVLPFLFAVFFLWFFRDPRRTVPSGEGLVVSPGDGVVTAADLIQTPDGERLRLSIFLSVFDVHVNRSPIAGVIREVNYRHGKYLNAMNVDSAIHNEQNSVVVAGQEGDYSYEVTFRQIAGLLARRIVFNRKVGDHVQRGERVGLIKFGSRVDVVLPGDARLLVAKGTRVKGGATALARLAGNAASDGRIAAAGAAANEALA